MYQGKNNKNLKFKIQEVKTPEDFTQVQEFTGDKPWINKARSDLKCQILSAIDDSDKCIGQLIIEKTDEKSAILKSINVADDLQREGVATKLKDRAEEILKTQNIERVIIGAHAKDLNNPNSPDLFDIYQNKWGFNKIIDETRNGIDEVLSRVLEKELI